MQKLDEAIFSFERNFRLNKLPDIQLDISGQNENNFSLCLQIKAIIFKRWAIFKRDYKELFYFINVEIFIIYSNISDVV